MEFRVNLVLAIDSLITGNNRESIIGKCQADCTTETFEC